MAKHNEFQGYIKLPKEKLKKLNIRLDFNGQVEVTPGRAELKGFYLRMFVRKERIGGPQTHPEMSVYLRPEEWLDLVDAMKDEFESHEKCRRDAEKAGGKKDSNDR